LRCQIQCLPPARNCAPGAKYDGKQSFTYFEGIARETIGVRGICIHILRVPPGGRAKAHLQENHETAIYVLEGKAIMY